MQAFEIAYRSDETLVALGWPKGLVEIHTVNPADGSPKELVAQVAFHKADIVHVSFTPLGELVSVSADGTFAVSSAETGAVRVSGSVGGEYTSAALSPAGRNLFLFSYIKRTASVFRVDVKSGKVKPGPAVDEHLGVSSRVFALTENTGLFWILHQPLNEASAHEGFCFVDFLSGRVEVKELEGGPASDFNKESRPLDVDPGRKLGVRLDPAPLELIDSPDGKIALIKLELFNLLTLRSVRSIVAAGTPEAMLDADEKVLLDGDSTSDAYRKAQDSLQRNITSVKLVPGADELWFGMRGGAVRRLKLDGTARSVFVQHGGDPNRDGATSKDVFARDLVNNFTLAVSRSGRFVVFGNPNEFFAAANVGLDDATTPIRLETRARGDGAGASAKAAPSPALKAVPSPIAKPAASASTKTGAGAKPSPGPSARASAAPSPRTVAGEAPVHVSLTPCGRKLVVGTRGDQFFLVDPASGNVERRVQLEPKSGEIVSVALSPNGKSLAAGVSGGDPFMYEPDENAVTPLGIPPHTIFTRFLSDTEVVFGHSHGAVVLCNATTGNVLVARAGDETADEAASDKGDGGTKIDESMATVRPGDKAPPAKAAGKSDDDDDDAPTVIADMSYPEFARLSSMGRTAPNRTLKPGDLMARELDGPPAPPPPAKPTADRARPPAESDERGPDVGIGLELAKFAERRDVCAGVHFVKDGVHYVGMGDEQGEVQLYAVKNGKLVVDKKLGGVSFASASALHTMVASGRWLAAPQGTNQVVVIDLVSGKPLEKLGFKGEVKGLSLGRRTGKLYAFDDRTGELMAVRVPGGEREVLYHHEGPAVGLVDVNEEAQRLVLVEADGTIQLVDLTTKQPVCALTVKPGADGVRELVRAS